MIRTLIIEDEQHSLIYLKTLLEQNCPNIYLVGTANSVEESVSVINTSSPDLVFMDVELSGRYSFEIFEQLPKPINFEIIFTTGHQSYAMQAIKYSCLDYLLKPIDGRDLAIAVQKYEMKTKVSINQKQIELLIQNTSGTNDYLNKIAITIQDGFVIINVTDIILCQADSNYSWIYTIQGEKILSSKNLQYFDDILPKDIYFRCHKSSIINLNHVKKFSKSDGFKVILKGKYVADISIRKKDDFIAKILKLQTISTQNFI